MEQNETNEMSDREKEFYEIRKMGRKAFKDTFWSALAMVEGPLFTSLGMYTLVASPHTKLSISTGLVSLVGGISLMVLGIEKVGSLYVTSQKAIGRLSENYHKKYED